MPDAAHPSPFCQMLPLSPSPPPPPTLFRPLASGKREKKKAFFSLEKSLLALLIEPCINAKGKKKVDRARFPMFAFFFPIACSACVPFPELIWTGPSHVEFPEHVTRQKIKLQQALGSMAKRVVFGDLFPSLGSLEFLLYLARLD